MKKIISIIGARPQFIKHAPMQLQLQKRFHALTIHTGQHYDQNMSDVFFEELHLPRPDFLFDIGGSKPQGEQTAIMMTEIEKVCMVERPDALLIYGDTNSTLSGALVAAKMHIPQIHIEAGLRSYNRKMPEEINRIIADEFADLLFCPTRQAIENLKLEGINHDRIFFSGDVMSDTLHLVQDKIKPIYDGRYYFATLHRPYNTDERSRLLEILNVLQQMDLKIILPLHPRTVSRMATFGIEREQFDNIIFTAPLGYVESISYQSFSEGVITDSGGVQKEAYMLRKKCITLRSETEWTETLGTGWNTLLFDDLEHLPEVMAAKCGDYIPNLYGDGHAAEKIVNTIVEHL